MLKNNFTIEYNIVLGFCNIQLKIIVLAYLLMETSKTINSKFVIAGLCTTTL